MNPVLERLRGLDSGRGPLRGKLVPYAPCGASYRRIGDRLDDAAVTAVTILGTELHRRGGLSFQISRDAWKSLEDALDGCFSENSPNEGAARQLRDGLATAEPACESGRRTSCRRLGTPDQARVS
jgi:hypothetical protein